MADLGLRSARLVIQSDRRLVREALAAYFAGGRGFTVVGHTATTHGLRTLCALGRPDVALIDVNALTARTVRTLRDLRTAFPRTDLVVAYTSVSLEQLAEAVRAGVTSFIPSSRGLDAVLRLLRLRVRRRTGVSPSPAADRAALTDRELGVISLLSCGHTVADIAQLLRISPHTVDNHKRRAYAKFGVGSQSLAVSRAMALGLVDPAPGTAVGRQPAGDRDTQPGRPPLAVVCGTAGFGMDQVLRTLAVRGLPFVHARGAGHTQFHQDHWAQWHRGPIIIVLVDPIDADWQVPANMPATVDTATVVVRSGGSADRGLLAQALAAGARALIYGKDVPHDLPDLLWLVARGYVAMSAAHATELASWAVTHRTGSAGGLHSVPHLSTREQEILGLMASGHTIRQAARSLGIAAKTVENTQARLYRKLGTHNRAETIAVAYRLGLLDPARA